MSNLLLGQAAFRGRNRETFSESRMREMRLSGSMSENRKQSHANRIEARSAKAALTNATGRLPLLRLFSTPLIDRVVAPAYAIRGVQDLRYFKPKTSVI